MENGNIRTVYVVQSDSHKDLSDARRFGQLRVIFGPQRKPYNTDDLIGKARRVLQGWQPGDYLLMLGDPALCAVCMTVAAEEHDVINVLSWDRNSQQYLSARWDFQPMDERDWDPQADSSEDFGKAD